MLILLSLLAADATVMMKVADDRLAAAREETPKASNARYRLDANADVPLDRKAAALAITGRDCERIGNLYCTSTPRMIYATAY